jgi:hypothetical protein
MIKKLQLTRMASSPVACLGVTAEFLSGCPSGAAPAATIKNGIAQVFGFKKIFQE